ncbi:MAG: addiction module protein [Planctomycetes bacterium]|nr:addiction module protein [Planctomycetota bacterium]
MPPLLQKDALLKLSVHERMAMIAMIWQTLVDQDADVPMSPATLAEMERRADLARKNPDEGLTLEESLKRLKDMQ